MFGPHMMRTLEFFDSKKYILAEANETKLLQETKKEGAVNLRCTLSSDSLILHEADKNVLPYLDGGIKGAKECADVFIYAKEDKEEWTLHLIEFKKTINTSTLAKSRRQFVMGIRNARAVAAFLGIRIDDIILYSGYRKDEITDLDAAALSAIRAANLCMDLVTMWEHGDWELDIDGSPVLFRHRKIRLDDMGNGSATI